ncbi:hypothetical protein CKQ90_18085, partial [Klebsiella pneumoniae]
ACFGLAFKPNIDDLRESPAMEIAAQIARWHSGTHRSRGQRPQAGMGYQTGESAGGGLPECHQQAGQRTDDRLFWPRF